MSIIETRDDVIKWKRFPRNWPFVREIHRSPVNSPHKGQWRGALMLSLICVWINGWVNNREADDFRRYRAHYDVTVMIYHHGNKSHLPITYFAVVQSFWNDAHNTAAIEQLKRMLWTNEILRDLSLIWVSGGYPILYSSLEPTKILIVSSFEKTYGNVFRITDTLWRESLVTGRFPSQRTSTITEPWYFPAVCLK